MASKNAKEPTCTEKEQPILDHCPYCGNYSETESFNEQLQVICAKCGKQNPILLPCPKCGSENGSFSKVRRTLKIICLDCGAVKKTIPNAK
jgi:transcription initiation factor TFIIIB Brf1 subunit/transcription initiation factor TFIIB